MTSPRITMFRNTGGTKASLFELDASLKIRQVTAADGELIGALLFAAYFGTIDHRGESLNDFIEEACETMLGRYGAVVWSASFVVLNDSAQVVSTSLVTENEKLGPLLAFAATLPAYRNRGLARRLIVKSLEQLKVLSVIGLTLVVTPGNDSAIHLYKKLGFAVCPDEG